MFEACGIVVGKDSTYLNCWSFLECEKVFHPLNVGRVIGFKSACPVTVFSSADPSFHRRIEDRFANHRVAAVRVVINRGRLLLPA